MFELIIERTKDKIPDMYKFANIEEIPRITLLWRL